MRRWRIYEGFRDAQFSEIHERAGATHEGAGATFHTRGSTGSKDETALEEDRFKSVMRKMA